MTPFQLHQSHVDVYYPVEDVGPALHGDALEHSEHGKQKVVEVGDAVVGALPALFARRTIEQAMAAVP